MESQAKGREFEKRVVDAYRALGYQVTHNVQLPGKQTDLLARREVEGAPTLVLAIECKGWDTAVNNDTVLEFIARVVAQKAAGRITAGVMVSGAGFTADAQAAGTDNPNVTLLSWEELSAQILDVRNRMRERLAEYEESTIYREYLPLKAEVLGWESLTPAIEQETLEEVLREWMGDRRPAMNTLFVLADFGAGKTTLLHRLEHDRTKACLEGKDPRIPLFVPLREYRNAQDLDALLRWSFRDAYYRDVPSDLLWSRIESGRLYVFFDGFDEMVERSDSSRRLDLFAALLPVLRSKSPTVLTSRPSYFVELGELEAMLRMLRQQEAEIATVPTRGRLSQATTTDRLSRVLVDVHREMRPTPDAHFPLNPRNARVLKLRSLDPEQIEEFLELRADELHAAGTSPQAVTDFIDRTYDLSDLASRPLLLTFIVSLIALEELDVEDGETQLGASGLYEIYTTAKLRHDMAKGRTRQEGLSLELRRELAEHLALRMYEARTLEVEFATLVEELMAEGGEIGAQLAESGFTREEVATDFATCSFVTLDQDGRCRFIHKSFRGFFVARLLKDSLAEFGEQMRTQNLESEVLYFLGGFAPTEPNLRERLWAEFKRTDRDQAILRRNLLAAFLYTAPEHDGRPIQDVEISAAEFGRLEFQDVELANVSWVDCVLRVLRLQHGSWLDTRMIDTQVGKLSAKTRDLELSLQGGSIDQLTSDGTAIRLDLVEASVRNLAIEGGVLSLSVAASRVEHVDGRNTMVHCQADGESEALGSATMRASRLRLNGVGVAALRAHDSIVVCDRDSCEMLPSWNLEACALRLDPGKAEADGRPQETRIASAPGAGDNRSSVVLCAADLPPRLLASTRAGVFGSLPAWSRVSDLLKVPRAWGVVDAQELFQGQLALPTDHEGYRHGDLLLVARDWYLAETGTAGALSALPELHALTEDHSIKAGKGLAVPLLQLLARIRDQFDALGIGSWPELERSDGESSEMAEADPLG